MTADCENARAALGIVDYLRRGFARFNLRAHLLNLRGLLFELRREDSHSLLQLLDFAVFFEELIEQHRVHRFVAYRVRLLKALFEARVEAEVTE